MKKRHQESQPGKRSDQPNNYSEPVFIEGAGQTANLNYPSRSGRDEYFQEQTGGPIEAAEGSDLAVLSGESNPFGGSDSPVLPDQGDPYSPQVLPDPSGQPDQGDPYRSSERDFFVTHDINMVEASHSDNWQQSTGPLAGPDLFNTQAPTQQPARPAQRRKRTPVHKAKGGSGAVAESPSLEGRTGTDPSQRGGGTGKKIRKKKKLSGWQVASRILSVFLVVVLVLALGIFFLWRYAIGSAKTGVKGLPTVAFKNSNEPAASTQPLPPIRDGQIINILLMGLDFAGEEETYSRSDTMMLATIDQKNNRLKLTSFQRDMLVYLPNTNRPVKLNEASQEGPQRLIDTLNNTFHLDIRDYILFNINGAEDVIDAVGGVEVNVPDDPAVLKYLNRLIEEQNAALEGWDEAARTRWSGYIWRGGRQLLDGRQAIAYARMRELDTDFHRMQRQQEIVELLVKKVKSNLTTVPGVVRAALSHVTTNLTDWELTQMGLAILPKIGNGIDHLQIPIKGYYWMDNGDVWCIRANFNLMTPLLHKFIYGEAPQEFTSVPLPPYTPLAKTGLADMPGGIYNGEPADVPYTGAAGDPGGEVLNGREIEATAGPAGPNPSIPQRVPTTATFPAPNSAGGADESAVVPPPQW